MLSVSVDVQNELADVAKEAGMLGKAMELYINSGDKAGPVFNWLAIQGLASAAEKIYTGCERVMAMLASRVDGAPVDHGDGWHSTLLKRMANPFPGQRGPIISLECYSALETQGFSSPGTKLIRVQPGSRNSLPAGAGHAVCIPNLSQRRSALPGAG